MFKHVFKQKRGRLFRMTSTAVHSNITSPLPKYFVTKAAVPVPWKHWWSQPTFLVDRIRSNKIFRNKIIREYEKNMIVSFLWTLLKAFLTTIIISPRNSTCSVSQSHYPLKLPNYVWGYFQILSSLKYFIWLGIRNPSQPKFLNIISIQIQIREIKLQKIFSLKIQEDKLWLNRKLLNVYGYT